MSAHRPTRMCPHRLCRPTHTALAVVGVVFLTQILLTGLVAIIFATAIGAIALGLGRLVHQKTLHQQILDDAADQGADVTLVVREGWARAAITLDLLVLTAAAFAVSTLFATRTMDLPTPDAGGYIALAVAIGITTATEYAHRQATRPARPKRVTKLAAAGSGA